METTNIKLKETESEHGFNVLDLRNQASIGIDPKKRELGEL